MVGLVLYISMLCDWFVKEYLKKENSNNSMGLIGNIKLLIRDVLYGILDVGVVCLYCFR